tara:strand:+ start:1159 stop:1380 length:222 start_codon:yes stop_codon:yes gene_type:complete
MSVQGIDSIVTAINPATGTDRSHIEVVQAGIERNNPNSLSEEALKNILNIQGDAVGTLNTQDVYNKTLNGGFF